jgi:cytochrome c peroxidase
MLCAALCVALLAACSAEDPDAGVMIVDTPAGAAQRANAHQMVDDDLSPRVLRRFVALDVAVNEAVSPLAALGRELYFDQRLSRTGKISCNSCHPLDRYGATHDRVSTGILGRKGKRNAPTTYNSAGQIAQMWDGRAANVEKQASMPLENHEEMDLSATEVVTALEGVRGYREEFARLFPGDPRPVSVEHLGLAIGAFERGLVTPSRWDRYLRGDVDALTPREKAGAKAFANLGCIVCHTGPYVGGSMFERLGARVPWPRSEDRGRKQVTGAAADDMVFKVPSLRNVAMTAPYFHDGSAATLNEAVRLMARHQLGLELDDTEANDLEAWLGSLTGDLPVKYIAEPALPGA